MQDPFDPYSEWLGLPDAQRPPDHYSLLGIPLLESDPTVISHAADVRMAQVRKIRPGQHLGEWGRLLDQLNAAKVCLSNPASKTAYDAFIRRGDGSQPPAAGPIAAGGSSILGASAVLPSTTVRPSFPAESDQSALAAPQPQTPPQTPDGLPGIPPATPGQPLHPAIAEEPADSNTSGYRTMAAMVAVALLLLASVTAYVLSRNSVPLVVEAPESTSAGPDLRQVSRPAIPPAEVSQPDGISDNPQRPGPKPQTDPSGQADPGQGDPQVVGPNSDGLSPVEPAPVEPDQAVPDRPGPTRPDPSQTPPDPGAKPATDPPIPDPHEPAVPADAPADPRKQAALARAVSDARFSMSERDLPAARRHLQAAESNVQTPADRAQLERLRTMLAYLDEFWNGMRQSVALLNAGQELELKTTRVVVVEASRDQLTVRAVGENRSWPIEFIPTSLVLAIAGTSFPDDATSKTHIGTFLAVDPKGDRARARQLWQEATQEGMDIGSLMPELDVAWPPGSTNSAVPTKAPPDQAELQQAEQSFRDRYASRFAAATSVAKKLALARELLAQADRINDDPTAQLVMLREARDLAVAAGKPAWACEIVDRMAELHTIDVATMKALVLGEVQKNARGLSSHREIATGALELIEQAVKANRLDEAGRLAALALDAAQNSRSPTLIQQAIAAGQRVEALRKQ
ncbi:MAG: hypothetical protein JXB62_11385 [Pirellulales bacterium]|nr:hypothetical protein [Pirellulales bacterium]